MLAEAACEVLAMIREHRDEFIEGGHYERGSRGLQIAVGRGPDGLEVFERERRARLNDPDEVEVLAPITLHEARHTCASLMIAAGVNPKALSVIMGHATISMTFDTYGHLMPGGLDEAAAAANAYLAKLGGGPALRVVTA